MIALNRDVVYVLNVLGGCVMTDPTSFRFFQFHNFKLDSLILLSIVVFDELHCSEKTTTLSLLSH